MKVYIVIGDTGEYSDHAQWIVCAYLDEEKAKSRVIELELLMESLGAVTDYEWDLAEAMHQHKNGNPDFYTSYTGTRYYYEATELKDG